MPHMRVQGPGEGWIDIFGPGYNWMGIQPLGTYDLQSENTPLPTVAPGSVATAEACFRDPSGWILCVLRNSLEYGKYQGRGYPEVSANEADFIPPAAPEVTRVPPTDVVPSHPSESVSEATEDVAIDWGSIASGIGDIYTSFNQLGQTPVFNYGGGVPLPTPVPTSQLNGASCGCNSNPCVCGTINGRPALVDSRTGKRCYRRRRRVMLTEGDFNTLLRIATLPNNANVRTALAKAIGRR